MLCVNDNQLENLPTEIGKLHKLREIQASRNKITFIPDSVGSLHQLKWLLLDSNRLVTTPETLGNIITLSRLELRHNSLVAIPDSSVRHLQNLRVLSTDNNPSLVTLPSSLQGLPLLEKLYVSRRQQDNLPPTLIHETTKFPPLWCCVVGDGIS